MIRRFSIKRSFLIIALALVSCLSLFGATLTLLWGEGAPSAVSADETPVTAAAPYREYTALDVSTPEDFTGIYVGITTVRGLKNMLNVRGTVNSEGNFNESETFTLAYGEYSLTYSDGAALSDSTVLLQDRGDNSSLALIVSCGTATRDMVVGVAAEENTPDRDSITAIDVRAPQYITDDHTAETVIKLEGFTVTDQEGNELRSDMYNVTNIVYSGSQATVYVSAQGNVLLTDSVTVDIRAATLRGVEIRPADGLVLEGLYYKTGNADGTKIDAFIKGANPEQIFSRLVVSAIYENSRRSLTLLYNEQHQLNGATYNGQTIRETISTTTTQTTDEPNRNVTVTLGSFTASISINFADVSVVGVKINKDIFNSALASYGGLVSYTRLLKDNFLSAVTVTLNDGTSRQALSSDIDFVGSLAPTAKVVNDYENATDKDNFTYPKTITVRSVSNEEASDIIEVSGIKYAVPYEISNINGEFVDQVMHHNFDYSGLTVTLTYFDSEEGIYYDTAVNLSDFYYEDNKTLSDKFLKTVITEKDGTNTDKITVNTARVSVTFSYGDFDNRDLTTREKLGIAGNINMPLNIVRDPVTAPVINTNTETFKEGLTKEIDKNKLVYGTNEGHNFEMSVDVYNNAECSGSSVSPEIVSYSDGKISFKSGGTFYVKVALATDEISQNEYTLVNGVESSNITTGTDGSIIYRITVNKGTIALNLSDLAGDIFYGDEINPVVMGTVGGRTFTLSNTAVSASETEKIYVPYKLVYIKSGESYDPNNYDYESYTVPSEISAGTYTVYAITQSTNAYLASKTRAGNGISVTVQKRVLNLDESSVKSFVYDRTTHEAKEFIDTTNANFATRYGHDADTVLNIDVKGATFLHAKTYPVTINIREEQKGNYTFAGGASVNLNFVISAAELTLEITATGFEYGAGGAAPKFTYNTNNLNGGSFYAVIPATPDYYKADASGNPTGNKITDLTFSKWEIGNYVAVFNTSVDKPTDEEGDYNLPEVSVTFTVTPAFVTRIEITESGWVTDLDSKKDTIGVYGSDITAILQNWGLIPNGNVASDGAEIVTVTVTGTRLAPDGSTAVSGGDIVVSGDEITLTQAGDYTLTISLNPNYVWKDTGSNEVVNYFGTVAKQSLSNLTLSDPFTYDGAKHTVNATFSVGGEENAWTENILKIISVTGKNDADFAAQGEVATSTVNPAEGTFSVTHAGDYQVAVSISDTLNYEWGDNSAENIVYTVNRAHLNVKWEDTLEYEFEEGGVLQKIPDRFPDVYAADNNLIALTGYEIYTDENCTNSVENKTAVYSAGTYYIKITAFGTSASALNAKVYKNYLPIEGDNYSGEYLKNISVKFEIVAPELATPELTVGGSAVSVEYKGSDYNFSEFIEDFDLKYKSADGLRVIVSVEGLTGNNPGIRNVKIADGEVAAYSVTVTPGENYTWQDKTKTPYSFTITVTKLSVTLKWENGSHVYGGTANASATVSNIPENSGDSVTVGVVYRNDENDGSQNVTPVNAGKYYSYASALGGASANNYTLDGTENRFNDYFVEKQTVAKPQLEKITGEYSGSVQTHNYSVYANLSAEVSAVRPADWYGNNIPDESARTFTDGCSFNTSTGVFTYKNAGYYSVTFTVNDGSNYCWTGEEVRNYEKNDYTYTIDNFAEIERKILTAPALGAQRAMEQTGGYKPFTMFTGSVEGANYSVLYGTRSDNGYGTAQADRADYDKENDSVIRGQYYALLIVTNEDYYNFGWEVLPDDGKGGFAGSAFIPGGTYYVTEYTTDCVRVYLYYAITASQVSITVTVNNKVGEVEGYTFGQNGYSVGANVITENAKITRDKLFTATPAAEFSDAEIAGTTYKIYKANSDKTANGEAFEENALIEGLPWEVGYYLVEFTITFTDTARFQDWTGTATFSVVARPIEVEWRFGGETVTEFSTEYNGAGQLPQAVVINVPKKTESDTPDVPELTLNYTEDNAPTDASEIPYVVKVSDFASGGANYSVVEHKINLTITPKELTVSGKDFSHVYGDLLAKYNTVAAFEGRMYFTVDEEIYSRDGQIILIEIRDGNTAVTETLNIAYGGNYAVVPVLNAGNEKSGNYVIQAAADGTLTVLQRTVTVTVKTDGEGKTLATSVYGEAPVQLNAPSMYTVEITNGDGNGALAENIFTLSADVDDKSAITTETNTYPITCTTVNDNYIVTFTPCDYVVTPATITEANVVAYGGRYDAAAHNLFNVSAKAVNGQSLKWYYKLTTESDWKEYTVEENGVANATARNVSDSKSYNVKVTADNHSDLIFNNSFNVAVTKAPLSVRVNIEIFYGEYGPHNYNGEGVWYKQTLSDLRDKNGIYAVTGLIGKDEELFYGTEDFYNLTGTFTYRYNGAQYQRGGACGDYALTCVISGGADITGLTCDNYTLTGTTDGNLKVKPLPVVVTIANYTATYNQADPQIPVAAVSTLKNSSYEGVEGVINHVVAGVNIVTVINPALDTREAGITTNNAGKYDISITLNANYVLDSGAPDGGYETATYTIDRADNRIDVENYELFTGRGLSAKDAVPEKSAWTYGNYSATHTKGYKADGDQKLSELVMLCYENGLTITVSQGDRQYVLNVGAGTANATNVFADWFADLYNKKTFTAGDYSVRFEMAQTTNYLKFEETWCFNVARKALNVTADSFSVTYGEDIRTEGYTFKSEGLATVGDGAGDALENVITFELGSDYTKGFENGSVKTGGYVISESQTVNGELFGNYIVQFIDGVLTVNARKISIEIVNLKNSFNLIRLDGTVYVKEDEDEYRFKLLEGTFAEGDGTVENNGETVATAQSVFNLVSEALTSPQGKNYATNNQGTYPIYLTAGAHYGTDGANYEITVVNAGYSGSGVPSTALAEGKAGTFTISRTQLIMSITGPFKDAEYNQAYAQGDADATRYDGNSKYYKPELSLPDGAEVQVVARYYEQDKYADEDILGYVPVNAGSYRVLFVTDDDNYVPALSYRDYSISKRIIEIDYNNTKTTNAGGGELIGTEGGYYFNGYEYTYSMAFVNFVAGETLTVETAQSKTLHKTIGLQPDEFMQSRYSVRAGDNNAFIYGYTARNSGVYSVTITLSDGKDDNAFRAANYQFDSNGAVSRSFTLNILLETLTVSTARTTVQYGDDLSSASFEGFTPLYFVRNVAAATSGSSANVLLNAEKEKGYISLTGEKEAYKTDYSVINSVWGTGYDLYLDTECIVAYNFNVVPTIPERNEDKPLQLVAREVEITVYGIDSEQKNGFAQCEYDGANKDHNDCLSAALTAHRDSFLKVTDGALTTIPKNGYINPVNGVNLRIDPVVRVSGKYGMAPSYNTDNSEKFAMYAVTFLNEKGEVIVNDLASSANVARLPKYEITKAVLTVKVGLNGFNVSFANINQNATLPYGTQLVMTGDTATFTVRYSGWKNGEGSEFGNQSASILSNVVLSKYTALDGSGKDYAAWESNYRDTFTVAAVFTGEYQNYTLNIIPAKLTVGQLTVTAEANHVTYTEKTSGNSPDYNRGVSGAEREIDLTFAGVEVALPESGINSEFTYTTSYVTTSANADIAGHAPTKAGTYSATVTLDSNGNYKFENGYTFTTTHVVDKKPVNIQWRPAALVLTEDENSRNGYVDAFVDDIMVVRTFNLDDQDIRGQSYYTCTNNGLTITVPQVGTYYLTVEFNSAAAVNYCWEDDESAALKTITLKADISEKAVTLTVSLADRVYGKPAADPAYKLINHLGTEIENAVVSFSYAQVEEGEFGTTSGVLANTEEVVGLSYSGNVPRDAGWYVVRAQYGGSENYLGARAFWLFNITKATASKPRLTVNGAVYTGGQLTAEIVYDTGIIYVEAFTGNSFVTSSTGSTLRAVNAGEYKVTFALRNTAVRNYEWDSSLGEDADAEVVTGDNGEITAVILTWNVAKATDNAVTWAANNVYSVTYGEGYSITASSTYTESATISYAPAVDGDGNDIAVSDVAEGDWMNYRQSAAGKYHVRAYVGGTANYDEAAAYQTLTINKARLTAIPYGTVEYGSEFTADNCGVNFTGFVNNDTGATIVRDESLIRYSHNAAELVVNDNGYKLVMDTYDGTDGTVANTVKGFSSSNYNIFLAENGGILRVTPKSVTVQIGNARNYYNQEIASNNLSGIDIRPLGDWDNTQSVSVLSVTLSTTAHKGSNVGTYPITGVSANRNYSVTFRSGEYVIEALKVRVGISAGGGEYGGSITAAAVNRVYYVVDDTEHELGLNEMRFTYRYTGLSNGGIAVNSSENPVLAGTYIFSVTGVAGNNNYVLDPEGNASEKFEVTQKVLDIANLSIASQSYTGNALEPVITDGVYNVGERTLYTVAAHDSFVNADTYRVRLQLTDGFNYRWSTAGELQFIITKAQNALIGNISITGWTYGQYNASVNTPSATTVFDSDNIVFMYATSATASESGWTNAVPSESNAGNYWVRATVYGTDNYERFDSAPVQFVISRVALVAPTLELNDGNSTYTGEELSAKVVGFDNRYMGITYSGIDTGADGYVLKATNANTYVAKISLRDGVNYRWADGTSCDAENNALLTWIIARKKVAFPSKENDALLATGEMLYFLPEGFDEELMSIEGNSAGYGGTFTAYVSLKDTSNYEWEDGSVEAMPVVWTIIGANTIFVVVISVLSGSSAIVGATAAGLFVRYRKKKRAEEFGPTIDDTPSETPDKNEGGAKA